MPETRLLNFLNLPWPAGLVLCAAGILFLVFGSRWRDFSLVLSTSFLAGAAALLFPAALPVNPLWLPVVACLASGLLSLLFPRAALTVLCAAVPAAVFALTAHLLCNLPTAHYLVAALSDRHLTTLIPGPDLHSPLVFTPAAVGLLAGLAFDLFRPDLALRVTLAFEGGLALVAGLALLAAAFFPQHLPPGYPMNYSQMGVALWFALAALGLFAQRAVDKSDPDQHLHP